MRPRIGVMLQEGGFPAELTVTETVRMWAGCTSGARPTAEALDLVGLARRSEVRVKQLSGGEKRRLDLALALLGRPEVLFFDEPTTGLDAEGRRSTWELVRELRDGGTTVLLTTHYLEEAEVLADRLAILHEGHITAAGTPTEVTASQPSRISFELPEGYFLGDLPPADLGSELAGAQSVLTAAGIDCEVTGSATGLPAQVQSALGWVVREATTNVLRHGDAGRCAVSLRVAEDRVTLTVENDGAPGSGSDFEPGRGSGLAGLRERLTGVEGVLRAGPAGVGVFRLTAEVPLPMRLAPGVGSGLRSGSGARSGTGSDLGSGASLGLVSGPGTAPGSASGPGTAPDSASGSRSASEAGLLPPPGAVPVSEVTR